MVSSEMYLKNRKRHLYSLISNESLKKRHEYQSFDIHYKTGQVK